MVADAIVRQVMLMIETHKAIHRGAVFGHVVGLDGAAVVGHGEIMEPFLVDGIGLWQRRVAKRVAMRRLFFFGVEVGAGVGISTGGVCQFAFSLPWLM